jgi:hypothetical protein
MKLIILFINFIYNITQALILLLTITTPSNYFVITGPPLSMIVCTFQLKDEEEIKK